MYFILSNNEDTRNCTSNITHYLTDVDRKEFESCGYIDPVSLCNIFGDGMIDSYDDVKGYTDPEWYFKGPNDEVLGVGFRWGIPRIRGKNIKDETIIEDFIRFLMSYINRRIRIKAN
mgnify:CR=1 FL=1